jgi:hypothetical protein
MWQPVTVTDQAVILQSTTVINEVKRAQCVFYFAKPYPHSLELSMERDPIDIKP